MKALVFIATALAVGFIGWRMASPKADPTPASDLSDIPKQPPPTTTNTNPTEVFQKAFWKHPTPEDDILRAERKEWADSSGLSKWQWVLSVKPSAALVEHLITQNAFMLRRSEPPSKLPEGFPESAKGYEAYTNASGAFWILWDKEENLLHATDSGSGFRPGAPEPVKAVVTTPPEGRLPTTPPPKP